jgi:para-aminobenzoate synthetase component 1
MTIEQARREMNARGRSRRPFAALIDFELEHPAIIPADECADHGLFFSVPNGECLPATPPSPSAFALEARPIDPREYRRAFDLVQHHLFEGNSFLVNLTFPTPIATPWTLDQIFAGTSAPYRVLQRNAFTVFSPEPFVRIAGGRISTHPMKGTIDATLPAAEATLIADQKEADEHATVVDLLRNDLSMIARNVRVERYRYVQPIATHRGVLLQTSSDITGELPSDALTRLGDILFALLPAGSVTGAPKRRTVEIIREAEGQPRGFYTGVFGLFDGETLDTCVLIRYIEQSAGGLVFRSGGGITHASDPATEYDELIRKVYVPLVRDHLHPQRNT